MNRAKRIILGSTAVLLFLGTVSITIAAPTPAYAAPTCDVATVDCPTTPPSPPPSAQQVKVCNSPTDACSKFITTYINPFIKLLTAIVGIGAALSLIIAGIRYSQSADDPSKVSQAKSQIVKTLIGLLAYIFLFAFLNYVIPGGLI